MNRTRSGKGVESSKIVQLRDLAPATIKRRQRIKLSNLTSPALSNLTETGEMLDSVTFNTKGNIITLFFKSASANAKAGFAQNGTRPFFDLADEELQELVKTLEQLLNRG